MKKLREKIESIVFAGLKPAGQRPAAVDKPASAMGKLRARLNDWISGGPAPSDPLYLTNRSFAQKARSWIVVAIPMLILLVGIGLTLSKLNPPKRQPAKEPTPAEVAAKLLPNLGNLKIEASRSIDVSEIRVERTGGVHVVGSLHNNTPQEIAAADITCDLTDSNGTQLGSITLHVDRIPASANKTFDIPVRQPAANFVMVREIFAR
jgi:hypothetical protein